MTQRIVVGVYDAESDAATTVRDLEAANVPAGAISQHTKANFGGTDFSKANAITHKRGFWGHFFGTTTGDDDFDAYDRSIERGSTVVTVRVSEEDVERVRSIMESHGPIDLEAEAADELPDGENIGDGDIEDTGRVNRVRCYVVESSDVKAEVRPTPKL